MHTYSPKEEIFKVLSGEKIGYFPRTMVNWVPMADVMRKLNQDNLWKVFYVPEEMAKLALAEHEICNWNGIMMGWVTTIEIEAMGGEISIEKEGMGDFPKVAKPLFTDPSDITFNEKEVMNSKIFNVMFEATKMVKEAIDKKYNGGIPIYASVQAPLTIASYMTDMNIVFKLLIKDPERVKKFLDKISDLNILYAKEMIKNGADFIHLSDPVAQGINESQFRSVLLPTFKKIREEFKDTKIIFHICGKTGKILEALAETGFDGYSFDYPIISFEKVKEVIGDKMAIIGSVPTISHLLEGSREDVFKSAIGFIEQGVDILSGSCSPPLGTPLENIRAMADAIKYWNKEKYGIVFND